MSQPCSRCANLPPAGQLDRAAGQFWVGNPWQIVESGHNLSAYERKVAYLNLTAEPGKPRFANMSFISGTDGDGDGRSAVGLHLFGGPLPDLLLRQAGGGPLRVYRNRIADADPKRFAGVTVRLRGSKSNAQGIGAELVASVGGRTVARDLYPQVNYACQQPAEAFFGLGGAAKIDTLRIRWPSGVVQTVRDLPAGGTRTIREADAN